VAGLISSPGVALHNTLLNTPSACVCDVVHWGLIALAKKLMNRNQVVACPPPLVECVFSTCLLLCMRSSRTCLWCVPALLLFVLVQL
jgi:hypothetical protein